MIEKVYDYMKKTGMSDNTKTIVAGLSGGADSVCLVMVLKRIIEIHRLGINIVTVHVNHGIRGEEAERDEKFAKEFAQANGLEFQSYHVNIPMIAKNGNMSEEEAGRQERYRIFREEAKCYPDAKIAVAHHMDDQAETVLMHLMRGTGLAGLVGMNPVNGDIIRPLLCVTRQDIEDFLEKEGQGFITDSTNLDDDYTRNKVRNILIPLMKDIFNPNVTQSLCAASLDAAKIESHIEKETCQAIDEYVVYGKEDAVIEHLEEFLKLDICIRERVYRNVLFRLSGKHKNIRNIQQNYCIYFVNVLYSIVDILCNSVSKGDFFMVPQDKIRNIAIIAHVDHGKTTLVDEMLKQGGIYRENQATVERVMDSGDLERERGITILAKNTSVHYKDYKINIVDTPGHADFGGEVERILKMVNGVILLVDAAEGPMPQTRFVLQKALELGHKVIVAVNKIDKPDARVHEVMDEVLELLLDLNATDEQFNSPTVFCSGRQGTASYSPDEAGTDLTPLFETIVNYIPAPEGDDTAPLQLLVSSIDYNDYVGRIAVGRVERGTIKVNQEVTICDFHDANVKTKGKVVALYEFDGLSKNPVQEAHAGEIVALSGMADITIGRTLCAPECVEPLPFVKISDPTIEMTFAVNDSPFAGKEGKFVTSRNLRDRLEKELLKDVSLHVTEQGTDSFNVAGRGEMHLSILMETMRREGYEFSVSTPRVLTKVIDGKVCEPIERMVADVPEECMGSVIEKMGKRKGDLLGMTPMGSRYRLEFLVPSRGLFGYRNEFLTDTRGEGVMSSVLDSYAPMKGEIERRQVGSLVAFETGEAVAYGLAAAQERGALFIGPGTSVYAGMVVGVCSRNEDMTVNVCKKKQLTNMRAAGSDEALRLTPPRILSLEQCLEFLADDELLECTPKSLRIRKRELDHAARMRNLMKKRAQDNA